MVGKEKYLDDFSRELANNGIKFGYISGYKNSSVPNVNTINLGFRKFHIYHDIIYNPIRLQSRAFENIIGSGMGLTGRNWVSVLSQYIIGRPKDNTKIVTGTENISFKGTQYTTKYDTQRSYFSKALKGLARLIASTAPEPDPNLGKPATYKLSDIALNGLKKDLTVAIKNPEMVDRYVELARRLRVDREKGESPQDLVDRVTIAAHDTMTKSLSRLDVRTIISAKKDLEYAQIDRTAVDHYVKQLRNLRFDENNGETAEKHVNRILSAAYDEFTGAPRLTNPASARIGIRTIIRFKESFPKP